MKRRCAVGFVTATRREEEGSDRARLLLLCVSRKEPDIINREDLADNT